MSELTVRCDDEVVLALGDPSEFISGLTTKLSCSGIDLFDYAVDHICYRCQTVEEYLQVGAKLHALGGRLLAESMVGGRPIANFRLPKAISLRKSDGRVREIWILEVPSPKMGRHYASGWEHVECVVGEATASPDNKAAVLAFRDRFPELPWELGALEKQINADISLSWHGLGCVKFHTCPLDVVIDHEMQEEGCPQKDGCSLLVPAELPSIARAHDWQRAGDGTG
mmetsp:Transcript_53626/g.124915  ORF Transcript_53626/g.124915 Transcript_53626/m.124915 type:complete len:226 (-) Transcript_53626:144-821(-)